MSGGFPSGVRVSSVMRRIGVARVVVAGVAAIAAACGGCASNGSAASAESGARIVTAAPESAREQLIGRVKSLEGEWETQGPDGESVRTVYTVSSAGSIVREIMFPGHAHEMTNIYHMDGDALVMTHYCASGNQPRMRATPADATADSISLHFADVTDLNPGDKYYMGEMTLVFHGPDKIEQRWHSLVNGEGEPHDLSLVFTRVK